MSPEEFVTLVNERISIGWPFRDWHLRLKAVHLPGDVNVRVHVQADAPHRDTGQHTGAVAQVHHLHSYALLHMEEGDAVRYIHRTMLRELVLHELDEAFHVGGVRVFDPHREETST